MARAGVGLAPGEGERWVKEGGADDAGDGDKRATRTSSLALSDDQAGDLTRIGLPVRHATVREGRSRRSCARLRS